MAFRLEKIKMMSICVFGVPAGVGAASDLSCQFPGPHTGEAVPALLCTIPVTPPSKSPPPSAMLLSAPDGSSQLHSIKIMFWDYFEC